VLLGVKVLVGVAVLVGVFVGSGVGIVLLRLMVQVVPAESL
jgi:hypothetical protein